MYSKYFGLQEMPFSIAPDPRYLYMSEQHREALAHLLYGFNSDGGFVLLTGEVGTGKTTVCRCLLQQIPADSAIAFILNPKLSVEELLETICDEFGIDYSSSNKSIKSFVDLINTYLFDAHSKGVKAVLIIDEAQNLSSDVLEQLRLLTNLETDKRKLLQIILIGQPELKEKLDQTELRQLSQRIIARYHLGPLAHRDVKAYIRHRLSVAGIKKELFSSSVIDKIFDLSGGIPRLINLLCDRALLGTFVEERERVSSPILKKAASEVFGKKEHFLMPGKAYIWALTITVITVAAFVFATTFNNSSSNVSNKGTVSENLPEALAVPEIPEVPQIPEIEKPGWPDDMTVERNLETALEALLKLWGDTVIAEDKGPLCSQAKRNGLRCRYAKGSLGGLRRLDRPAVLKLIDARGDLFYVTLSSLGDSTAELIVGSKTIKVSTVEIEARWFGDYILLWKTPPGYSGYIKSGDSGPAVVWLREQLSGISGETDLLSRINAFDNELYNKVMMFQRSAGLIPDGIAGVRTLIRINSLTGINMPTLSEERET
jgi:general secretion pathway protein A